MTRAQRAVLTALAYDDTFRSAQDIHARQKRKQSANDVHCAQDEKDLRPSGVGSFQLTSQKPGSQGQGQTEIMKMAHGAGHDHNDNQEPKNQGFPSGVGGARPSGGTERQ